MIAKELFDELGGLSGAYIQGDYKDSDLCLRLRQFGHRCGTSRQSSFITSRGSLTQRRNER